MGGEHGEFTYDYSYVRSGILPPAVIGEQQQQQLQQQHAQPAHQREILATEIAKVAEEALEERKTAAAAETKTVAPEKPPRGGNRLARGERDTPHVQEQETLQRERSEYITRETQTVQSPGDREQSAQGPEYIIGAMQTKQSPDEAERGAPPSRMLVKVERIPPSIEESAAAHETPPEGGGGGGDDEITRLYKEVPPKPGEKVRDGLSTPRGRETCAIMAVRISGGEGDLDDEGVDETTWTHRAFISKRRARRERGKTGGTRVVTWGSEPRLRRTTRTKRSRLKEKRKIISLQHEMSRDCSTGSGGA